MGKVVLLALLFFGSISFSQLKSRVGLNYKFNYPSSFITIEDTPPGVWEQFTDTLPYTVIPSSIAVVRQVIDNSKVKTKKELKATIKLLEETYKNANFKLLTKVKNGSQFTISYTLNDNIRIVTIIKLFKEETVGITLGVANDEYLKSITNFLRVSNFLKKNQINF